MAKVNVNNPRPQETPGFVQPLCPVVKVPKTKLSVLRRANTAKVTTEAMKKTKWKTPPRSSSGLRSWRNHRLHMKGMIIIPHIIKVVCHAFGV